MRWKPSTPTARLQAVAGNPPDEVALKMLKMATQMKRLR